MPSNFRNNFQADSTTKAIRGKNQKNETSFVKVASLVLFFVILLLVLALTVSWWWCKKKPRKSQCRRRFSKTRVAIQKCECKYKKVEHTDEDEVHNADTLPIQCSRRSSQKSQSNSLKKNNNYQSCSSKELKDVSDDCHLNDECTAGQTKAEIYAAPSSDEQSDFIESASTCIEKLTDETKSNCQRSSEAQNVDKQALEHQRGTNTVKDLLKTCDSECEEADLVDLEDSEILATENKIEDRLPTDIREEECNCSQSKGIDESRSQSISSAASEKSTREEGIPVKSTTIASNSDYFTRSIKEEQMDRNSSNAILFSTSVLIKVLPVDITSNNLNTFERKRRFDKIVAALPVGYSIRNQLQRGFSNLKINKSSSTTDKAENCQSSKSAEVAGKIGSESEACSSTLVCGDRNTTMLRRFLGQRRSRAQSSISVNSSVEECVGTIPISILYTYFKPSLTQE